MLKSIAIAAFLGSTEALKLTSKEDPICNSLGCDKLHFKGEGVSAHPIDYFVNVP